MAPFMMVTKIKMGDAEMDYHKTMVTIYEFMNKGEAKLSQDELMQLAALALAAETYEDEVLGLEFR